MKNRRSLVIAMVGLFMVLFLFLAPAFPTRHEFITGTPAELAYGCLLWPCVQNPTFTAPSNGYASATYLLFGIGTQPDVSYPVNITVYSTLVYPNGSSITTPQHLIFRDAETVCLIVNATTTKCAVTAVNFGS